MYKFKYYVHIEFREYHYNGFGLTWKYIINMFTYLTTPLQPPPSLSLTCHMFFMVMPIVVMNIYVILYM